MELYIRGVLLIGALSSAVLAFLPKDGGTTKYVSLTAQLLMLLVITAPLTSLGSLSLDDFPSRPQAEGGESRYTENVLSYSADSVSRAVAEQCEREFSLEAERIGVRLIIDDSDLQNVKITELQLFVEEKNASRRREIQEYFAKLLACRVYVFGP